MNKVADKSITPAQLKGLQTMFSRMGWDKEQRHEFVHGFTSGRTSSSRELSFSEARRMISSLNGDTEEQGRKERLQAKEVVGRIYGLSLSIGFLNAPYESADEDEKKMNYAKLSKFLRERGAVKKNINQMNLEELLIVEKQLHKIKGKEAKHAGQTKDAGA